MGQEPWQHCTCQQDEVCNNVIDDHRKRLRSGQNCSKCTIKTESPWSIRISFYAILQWPDLKYLALQSSNCCVSIINNNKKKHNSICSLLSFLLVLIEINNWSCLSLILGLAIMESGSWSSEQYTHVGYSSYQVSAVWDIQFKAYQKFSFYKGSLLFIDICIIICTQGDRKRQKIFLQCCLLTKIKCNKYQH